MNLLQLIESFLSGDLSAFVFENAYTSAWRAYRDSGYDNELDEKTQEYVDRVFTTLDLYCAEPELRDEGDLDDHELLNEIIQLNKQWRKAN